jgi:hypothetical protein
MSSFERYSCGVIWSGSESMMSLRVEDFGRLSMANCLSGCMLMSFSLDILVLAECEKIYSNYYILDQLGMSLTSYDDEDIDLIVNLFKAFPEGLGKREVWRYLEGRVSRNTIDKKMKVLIESGFIKVEPDEENYRQGQSKNYVLKESFELYLEFLNKILSETGKFIIILSNYLESSDNVNSNLIRMLEGVVGTAYRLPHFLDVIHSWSSGWLNNEKLMKDLLFLWYVSYREVNSIIDRFVKENIEKVNQTQREERKNVENVIDNKIIDGVDLFDKMDENFLNFYRDPKQKLDTLYQDIKLKKQ